MSSPLWKFLTGSITVTRMVLRPITHDDGLIGYNVICPGCRTFEVKHLACRHMFLTVPFGAHPVWEFDGNMERPTFSPSLLMKSDWWNPETEAFDIQLQCHFFLRDGIFEYLDDCNHKLAGQNVPMVEFDKEEK